MGRAAATPGELYLEEKTVMRLLSYIRHARGQADVLQLSSKCLLCGSCAGGGLSLRAAARGGAAVRAVRSAALLRR